MMDFEMSSVGQIFELLRSAIGGARDAKELLPDANKKLELEIKIKRAEADALLAEAQLTQLAQSIGYHLCQCTFPPQIMLKVSHSGVQERYSCSLCGSSWPPPRIDYPKAVTDYDPFCR